MKILKNIESVYLIRKEKKDTKAGVYRWWFRKESAENLLASVKDLVEWDHIQRKSIDGEDYLALYFGMTKNIRNRLKWHISQKHRPNSIKMGLISTLRKTLSALLDQPLSASEEEINQFIDGNCVLEWEYCDSETEAKKIEKEELEETYYPLNLQGNKRTSKELKSVLKQKRKECLAKDRDVSDIDKETARIEGGGSGNDGSIEDFLSDPSAVNGLSIGRRSRNGKQKGMGVVRPEDCIPPSGLKEIPGVAGGMISREIGDKIAQFEGYEKKGGDDDAVAKVWQERAKRAASQMQGKGEGYERLKAKLDDLYKATKD